jgi:hypothetical protein
MTTYAPPRRRRSLPARMDAAKTPLVCFVLVFFETFSIVSTGTGLHAFFNGFASLPPQWGWALVIALAAGFHLLGMAWFLRFRQTRHAFAILPYVIFSLIFVGFSWSWHWAHFRGAEVASQDLTAKVAQLEQTLYTARAALALIADKTNELATYSERRAAEEEKTGGTCGDRSGPNPGKRYWLRMDDQREAQSLADAAHTKVERLDALIGRARELAGARDGVTQTSDLLDAIYNELAAFVGNDAAVSDIRDRTDQRLRLSQNGYDVPGFGLTRCPDPTRDALLGGVLKAAKMPPLVSVRVMNPESVPEAQKRIWARAANTLAALWVAEWGGHADPAVLTDRLAFQDYVALGTASFVEFSVLMCLMWLPRPRRGVGLLVDEVEGLDDERSPLLLRAFQRMAEGLDPREARILADLEDHLWWPDPTGNPILLVPIAPRQHALPTLYRLAELLVEVDLAQIPRSHAMYLLRLRWFGSGARQFRSLARLCTLRLYKIDRHAYRQLTIVLALHGFRPSGDAAAGDPPRGGTDTDGRSASPPPVLLLPYRPSPAE